MTADYVPYPAPLTTRVLQDERIKGLPVPPGVCPIVSWRGRNKGPLRPKRGTCARAKGLPIIGYSL